MRFWSRFVVLFFLCVSLALIPGCQTLSMKKGTAATVQNSASSQPVAQAVGIDGEWLTLFHHQGNDYFLETRISTEPGRIHLALSGEGKVMNMPTSGGRTAALKAVPRVLSGKWDSEAGAFDVEDQGGANPIRLIGVFGSEDRFAAVVHGRSWQNTSLLIGVRKKGKDDLEALMAKADSKLGKILSHSSLGTLFSVFKAKAQGRGCTKDETAWAKQIQEAADEAGKIKGKVNIGALATAMFNDEHFRSAFGEPFHEIGLEEGQVLADKLGQTQGCGQLNTRSRLSRDVLNAVVMILQNRSPLTRDYVMINNAAADIIRNWMAGNESRLEAIPRAFVGEPAAGLQKVDALVATSERMGREIWPSRTTGYGDQVNAARTVLTKNEFLQGLDREIAKGANSLEDLNRLAQFPASHGGSYKVLTAQEKAQVKTRIATRVDSGKPDVVAAANEFAARQHSVADMTGNLAPFRSGKFSALAQYASPQHVEAVQKIFDARRTVIEEGISRDATGKMNAILADGSASEAKLRALVALRDSFLKSNRAILDEPITARTAGELRQQCLSQLESLEPGILAKIKTARSPSQINDLLAGLTTGEDRKTPAVARISAAQQRRVDELLAFRPAKSTADLGIGSFTTKDLNYGTEMMAIYLGDFQHARLSPDEAVVSGLFERYLYAYGRYCADYLPKDKVPITEQICIEETETTYLSGRVETECSQWGERKTGLYADRVLYAAHKRLGYKAGTKTFMDMFKSGNPLSGMSVVDDAMSIGNDMDRLVRENGCGNAGLDRFERNFYNFIEGRQPLLLPGKETLAMVRQAVNVDRSANAQNLGALLDDLIAENAKGWMMNVYQRGSVGNIMVDKNGAGLPSSVRASYVFSSMGQRANGQVVLKFQNDIPACLYFSDAPQTCRHPSKRIIKDYENGRYQK
ncbi:hypothetical protein [uncultured Pseudodesulfovibrio sp.]|uniref:hypothetical protein n=1 Tax=uncultured Pseudodesulfovibrio sp. TaxID=2035858 RepID=UPI0029C98B63|nr:hypothetical protein [uncultured Pseudodesulfovibrio sp.]